MMRLQTFLGRLSELKSCVTAKTTSTTTVTATTTMATATSKALCVAVCLSGWPTLASPTAAYTNTNTHTQWVCICIYVCTTTAYKKHICMFVCLYVTHFSVENWMVAERKAKTVRTIRQWLFAGIRRRAYSNSWNGTKRIVSQSASQPNWQLFCGVSHKIIPNKAKR